MTLARVLSLILIDEILDIYIEYAGNIIDMGVFFQMLDIL